MKLWSDGGERIAPELASQIHTRMRGVIHVTEFVNVTGYCNNEENDSDVATVCERYALEQEIELLKSRIDAAVKEHDASGDADLMLAAIWPTTDGGRYMQSEGDQE